MASDAVAVLVAHGHALTRAALATAVATIPEAQVVADAPDAQTALSCVRSQRIDLALVSAELPTDDGITACAALKEGATPPRVVVVGDRTWGGHLFAAVESGADGYVGMDVGFDELVAAIVRVAHGEAFVPASLLGALLRRLTERRREGDRAMERFMRLTSREREVLELLVDGCDHEAVAEMLVISPQTARTHIQHVISKLGVHSRLEAASYAVEHQLAELLPVGRAR